MIRPSVSVLVALAAAACGSGADRGDPSCGLAAIAGPTALLNQFGVPRQTLGVPPDDLPERLVVRVVAGPALPAVVGRADTSSDWIVGVQGEIPASTQPGYGVLVLNTGGEAQGVMLYEGQPVEGAPRIGTVSAGSANLPLIGIQLDPGKVEDPRCPFFPDSVLR